MDKMDVMDRMDGDQAPAIGNDVAVGWGEPDPSLTLRMTERALRTTDQALRMTDQTLRMTDQALRMTDQPPRMTAQALRMTEMRSG
ncbi:hypothetical protein K8I61_06015 [bacterium]|nr:hypothetical protein [bacterium]